MKINVRLAGFFVLAFALCIFCAADVFAQKPAKAPAYKITNIKIVPFDSQTGNFEEELTTNSTRSFFNDLAISLFVTVEISGEAGSFESGRMVSVSVLEGKKLKIKKTDQVGLIGESGKFYFPVFLESAMCDQVKISAFLTGQKTVSKMSRSVPFMCGE